MKDTEWRRFLKNGYKVWSWEVQEFLKLSPYLKYLNSYLDNIAKRVSSIWEEKRKNGRQSTPILRDTVEKEGNTRERNEHK